MRLRDRIVAIDDEAVLLAPYASRLPFQLMLVPRAPAPRFEDDGPPARRCCTTRCYGCARALGALAAAEPVGPHRAAAAPTTSAGTSTSCRA